MEAHIELCIASTFSNVPKAYSSNNIEQYLKLHEMFLNGGKIFYSLIIQMMITFTMIKKKN